MIKPSRQTHALRDGRVVVDWSHLWKLLYDMRRTENYSKPGFQTAEPMGSGVNVVWIEFDRAAADARAFADTESARLYKWVCGGQCTRAALQELVRNDAAAFDQAFNRYRSDTQARYRANTEAAQKNAEFWGKMVTAAQITSKGSAEFVLALAAVVPLSAAAFGGLALSTALASGTKGLLAVQEARLKGSQAIGAGVISTSVTFFGALMDGALQASPVGKGATWAVKGMLALAVQLPMKTANSMVLGAVGAGEGKGKAKGTVGQQLLEHYWEHTVDWGGECAGELGGNFLSKMPLVRSTVARTSFPARSLLKPSDSSAKYVAGAFEKATSIGGEWGAHKAYEAFNSSTQDAEGHLQKLPLHGGADVKDLRVKTIVRPVQ